MTLSVSILYTFFTSNTLKITSPSRLEAVSGREMLLYALKISFAPPALGTVNKMVFTKSGMISFGIKARQGIMNIAEA